jgi:hypothetical protein
MLRFLRPARALPLVIVLLLATPAAANAWQVTVKVHGAGKVVETTPRALMNCTTSSSASEATITNCVGGTPSGVYNSGDIVTLAASVPQAYFDRGWRFDKWIESSADHSINCDPQGTLGNHTSATCTFQIFDNLAIDLYFDDVAGPGDTSITSGPTGTVPATGATFGFNAVSDPDASFQCKLDRPSLAGSFVACGGPLDKSESYSGLTTNGSYTFSVRSVDPSGNTGNTVSRTWTIDNTGPNVSINGGPAPGSRTKNTLASFSLTTNEPASFQCRLDGPSGPGGFVSCSSTPGYASLPDGTYTLSVRGIDGVGNAGPTVTRTWTVDTAGPTTSISGGPANGSRTVSTGATFGLTASESATYECKLDTPSGAGSFVSCTSSPSYSGLTDGSYTLTARGTDDLGNVGPSSATRTWTVDTQAPDTSITSGPSGLTSSSSPTFGFSSTEANSTFECKLDTGAWEPCNSTTSKSYTSLSDGEHSFRVRATDDLAHTDSTEAVRTFTIDTVAPDTSISSGPSGDTTSTSASFGFTATEPGATFECKLDAGAWASCTSAKAYSGLATGPHTFLVRATDAAGNLDQSEAARGWTVKAPPSGGGNTGGTPPGGGTQPGGTEPDTTKPVATITFAKQRLARVLRVGFVGSAVSTEGGTLRLDVLLAPKLARKLKLAGPSAALVVAKSATRTLGGPGSAKLTAKFTKKAKKALARLRTVKLTLRLTATDAAGNASVKTRSVTLRR